MNQRKILFIDRDGTLNEEPFDNQVDALEKVTLVPGVIPALLQLKQAGYTFVLISNQDGLGTERFPTEHFEKPHQWIIKLFASQGITFEAERICPHLQEDRCDCRKPRVGLILDYLNSQMIDKEASYVIGDRETDIELAKNMGIKGIKINKETTWQNIVDLILKSPRSACVTRKTKETDITVNINLDSMNPISINTGIGFFDHMLEQLAKHGGFSLAVHVNGDLHIDEHHTIEDTAIAIGEAMKKALGDKHGLDRYGFLLPMDESLAQIAIDLSGRSYIVFDGTFPSERVGELSTEMVPHFFRSLSESLKANLHIQVKGENTHHMVESIFKGVGRALRQAFMRNGTELPSTKGLL